MAPEDGGDSADADLKTERLKSALWFSIGQLVDAETLRSNQNATPQFIGALTEMVWAQISTTAKDLETFAKHANRTTITTDDVLLLARRNEGLESLLRGYVDEIRAAEGGGGNKRKGKGRAGR